MPNLPASYTPFTPEKQSPAFSGLITEGRTVTTLSTAGNLTYTTAQVLGGIIFRDTNGGARTDALPTAAQFVAAIEAASVGTSFRFHIRNTAGAANTLTVAVGTGGTGSGTLTIAQNNAKDFFVLLTNVTPGSEAYTLYSLGTVVF